nr:zinc finger, CCHC-type [Tanacetum cinerariifolium]
MALNNAQTKTNSLAFRSMLEKHQLTGPNFNEWFRALKLEADAQAFADSTVLYDSHNEVACLMIGIMAPKLYYQFEHNSPLEMVIELQKMYGKPPSVELQELVISYYFYYPPENKIVVERYANFLEKDFILQKESERILELEDEDILPYENTREHPIEEENLALIVSQEEGVIPVRRSVRTHKAPDRLCLNVEIDPDRLCFNVEVEEHSLGDLNEPANYKAALSDPEFEKWLVAMNAEMQSILVVLLPNAKVVKSKWVYKKKTNMDGKVHIYKARLVANGCTQTYGVDYEETFSPVADIRAIMILIAIAAYYDYEICLQEVKTYLGKCFSMKDLGEAAFILRIKIYRDRSRQLIGLSQNSYLDKILKRYRMDNSKRGSIPMQVDLYLSKSQCATTSAKMKLMKNVPYALAVGSIIEAHWTAVKNILKYLRSTKDKFLVYGGDPEAELRVMAEEDAFLVDDVECGLCVDNTDAGIDGRFNSGSNKDNGKELWDSLESKYMAEDSSSKKFLVSNFNNYKMVDSRPVMEQYNELLRILGQYTQHGLKMDDSISVSSIIDKLPLSWKDFKHTLKHGKDDLSLVQLSSHLRIEESLMAQDSDKGMGKEVVGPSVNMTKLECWKCGKTGHFKRDFRIGNKKNKNAGGSGKGLMQLRGGLIPVLQLMFVKIVASLRHIHRWKTDLYFTRVYESDKYILSKCGVFVGFGYYNNGHVHYKRLLEMSKDELIPAIDKNLDKCTTYRCGEYYDPVIFQSVEIIHETIAPYTPQQNGVAKRKNRALKEVVNSMLSYSGLSEGDDHSDDVPSEIPEPRKEAIDDEIGSIMENNTWVLSDLPPGCKPLGCKWIFKRKMKVNGTIDKFKARLHKVCKLVKSLYGLKQAPKKWHQKFDEVVLSSGFLLNESDKCVYSKFDSSGKGVIICLYVDDMLIFGTDQNQVDKIKKFLSSKFSMKDMGEADVILGIKIKRENIGIVITQSHYIDKILKKFNREDCSPMSTPMDPVEKLKPNTGKPVDQLEYSRAIGCLMYAMTSTRLDIAYAVGIMNYGLSYVGYPSVLEAYSYASWIHHVEDASCMSGWVFLLGEVPFHGLPRRKLASRVLAAAGKEVEWLRNFIHEIPIWPKPIAPISI